MQKTNKSVQVFKNPILEKMTHAHPLTPLLVWGPIIVGLLWHSLYVLGLSMSVIAPISVSALVTWSLVEYVLHRFVFHYEGESVWSQKIHFLIHGIHHVDPNDPTRLVMPPLGGIAIAAIIFPMFRAVLGPIWVEPFLAFFLVGYLIYDYTHFAVHYFRPLTRYGKMLKNHHMQHHFAEPNSRWGVSTPIWDFVFGTLEGDVKDKQSTV
jgi:sterol desaturase/sphingolipid hydroxylase (fatty acid hydroxylase superfamily)